MPSSISTVRCVAVPSSSTLSEPRRPGSVPSSTTVTPGAATRWPRRPAKAEVPLRMKSPSSPWPTASWSSTPGQPGPSTTSMLPAGQGTASRFRSASRTASSTSGCQKPGASTRAELAAAAAALARDLAASVRAFRDHLDVQTHQRLHVRHEGAVAGRDQHVAVLAHDAREHLAHARIAARGRGRRSARAAPPCRRSARRSGAAPTG